MNLNIVKMGYFCNALGHGKSVAKYGIFNTNWLFVSKFSHLRYEVIYMFINDSVCKFQLFSTLASV